MSSFLKRLWPSIKFLLIIMGTQCMLSLFSIVLGGISVDTHIALRIVLGVLFLAGVVVMVYAYSRNTAYNEFNRRQNNRARERNNEPITDEMRGREYVWYKGYLVGLADAIPLIILTTLALYISADAIGWISVVLYGCYAFPIYLAIPWEQTVLQYIAVVIIIAVPGVTYHVQGIKMQKGLDSKIDSRIKRK